MLDVRICVTVNKRLLAFGDSFCRYAWPMWPEILGQNFEEFVNLGAPGCGNFYIYKQFLLSHICNNIQKTDTVIVQWSEPSRHDYIRDGVWIFNGSESAELFLKSNVADMNNDETAIYKTVIYMIAVVQILESIGCNWFFLFLNDYATVYKKIEKPILNLDNNQKHKLDIFRNYLLQFQNTHFVDGITMEKFIDNKTKKSLVYEKKRKIEFDDGHPLPVDTLNYLKQNQNILHITDCSKMEKYVDFCMPILKNEPYDLSEISKNYEEQIKETEFNNATQIDFYS